MMYKANKKTDFIHMEGLAKASPMFLDYKSPVVQMLVNAYKDVTISSIVL